MYQEISQLLMYGDLDEDSILAQMGEVFGKYETGEYNKTGLVRDINTQVKRILKVATDYGFDDNLWHNYLTFFLMMSENPFSMTCEKVLPNCSARPFVTAFCPKYGSMTMASRLNRSFNPTRIGRKLLTSPPEPTDRIIYPTVALINPENAS